MVLALLADIHANLEAFQVVLEDIKQQKCTHFACLGDVVGYNANPKECLDIVRNMNIPVVKGNHDEYCSSEGALDGFNPAAAEAVNWTRKQLSDEDRQWLRDLKYTRMVTNFTIVHATLDGPQRWGYVFDKLAAAASFTYQNTAVCFFGHTHVPMLIGTKSLVTDLQDTKTFQLDRNERYMINPGSVGQPRDKCPLSSFGIFDTRNWTMTFIRKPYDFRRAQKLIIESGLPEKFARRLSVGV